MTDTPERMVPIEEALAKAKADEAAAWRVPHSKHGAMAAWIAALARLDALRAARARGETLVTDGE